MGDARKTLQHLSEKGHFIFNSTPTRSMVRFEPVRPEKGQDKTVKQTSIYWGYENVKRLIDLSRT